MSFWGIGDSSLIFAGSALGEHGACFVLLICEKLMFFMLCYVLYVMFFMFSVSFKGSIVSVGDPKKKYTRFEKIGQGLVGTFCFPRKVT